MKRSEKIQVEFWRWSHDDWLMDRRERETLRTNMFKCMNELCMNVPQFCIHFTVDGNFMVYSIGPLGIILLWIFSYISFNAYTYAFLSDTYQKVELLCHRVYICSDLVDLANFPKWLMLIYFPTSSTCKFQIIYIFVNTWFQFHVF